jgi:hypothetical protein
MTQGNVRSSKGTLLTARAVKARTIDITQIVETKNRTPLGPTHQLFPQWGVCREPCSIDIVHKAARRSCIQNPGATRFRTSVA